MLTEILLLIVVYLGFWFGIALGFIASEELNSFFLKLFKLKLQLVYGVIPLLVLFSFKYQLLVSSLCFLLGFPLGSLEVKPNVNFKKRKVENKKKLIISCFKKTGVYFVVSILALILFSSFF